MVSLPSSRPANETYSQIGGSPTDYDLSTPGAVGAPEMRLHI
jgi:hypothetical protein